jgi:hypothetical protein
VPYYHIRVLNASNARANIYANSNCTGSMVIRQSGGYVTSKGWDGARMNGENGVRKVVVVIVDDKTGKWLATREKPAGVCFPISDNAHSLQGV